MRVRHTTTSRRAQLRRGARLRRLAKVLGSLVGLVEDVRCRGGGFGVFLEEFGAGRAQLASHPCRDLLPIPPIDESIIVESYTCIYPNISDMTQLVNFSLAGMNYLYGGFRSVRIPRYTSAVQKSAQLRLVSKWWGLVKQASCTDDFLIGLGSPVDFSNVSSLVSGAELVADKVDGLTCNGVVDPDSCLPSHEQELFGDPSLLFPDGLAGIPQVSRYTGGSRLEYAALVACQLRPHKTALSRRPTCSANIFVVSKRGTDRLREVWDGSLISAASKPCAYSSKMACRSCSACSPRGLLRCTALLIYKGWSLFLRLASVGRRIGALFRTPAGASR